MNVYLRLTTVILKKEPPVPMLMVHIPVLVWMASWEMANLVQVSDNTN